MDRDSSKGFLGSGWKFPVEVDPATGRIKSSDTEKDIEEAVKIIIMTAKGERVMRPDFGTGLNSYMFGDNDFSALSQIEYEVTDALVSWEPRITDIDVAVSADDESGNLYINISYRVRETNNMFNLVYPYFINEGII